MADEKYNAFDYYAAEPPREDAVLPPEEAAASAPEDEFNERVHGTDSTKRTAGTVRSVALALAVGSLALSYVISSGGIIPNAGVIPTASVVTETTDPDNGNGKPGQTVTETTAAPTPTPEPTPSPTPTPVPVPTDDLGVRLDSVRAYPLTDGFLSEIKFTLFTNCGIDVSSVKGSVDSRMFIYDGYNFKKRKMKYHYENLHKEFSLDTAKVVIGSGAELTEKQYVVMVKLPKLSSEDKLAVTLTVSNTLNGNATEDKVVTIKNVLTWNNNSDTYAASLIKASVTKGKNKTFDVKVTPGEDVPVTNIKINNIYAIGKKAFSTNKDFKITYSGDNIHIAFKKPKKAPSKGTLSLDVYGDYEVTDSNGTTFKGRCYTHVSKKY